ncbi:MAG: hypothetical protein J6R32_00290 [Bacteroidales bacterium]|nr:hypothetical protein [Bacteroidales bacterium]
MAVIDMKNEKLSPEELKFMKKHLARWNNNRKQAGLDFTLSERIANVEMLSSKLEMKIEKEFIKVYVLITVISLSVAILSFFR